MHKAGSDPKVKKTLVRNCEKNIKSTAKKYVVRDVGSTSRLKTAKSSSSTAKENDLNQPTLCSSEALAQYLSDVMVSSPPPLTTDDLNVDKSRISAKITKKLNFQFNDRIYRNLIELNANVEDQKKKKDKKPSNTVKRDLEPNIEDFYEEEKDEDSPPNIPVIRPKFKPVRKIECGQLHRIVAAFENL